MDARKKRMRNNFLYIFLYIIFISIFPFLRNNLNNKDIKVDKSIPILVSVEKSTNFISNNFNSILYFFYSKKYLLNKISSLEEQVASINNENIIKENKTSADKNIIVSKKIFQDFTSVYDNIILDKGLKDGVELGNIVFDSRNNAIGKIVKVNELTSTAVLFSKSGEIVEGVIYGDKGESTTNYLEDSNSGDLNIENGSTTISQDEYNHTGNEKHYDKPGILIDLYGYGGGDFISNIPENIVVSTGSKLYLAIDESKYLGEVVEIEKGDASYYQKLFIRGYYNTRINTFFYIEKQ